MNIIKTIYPQWRESFRVRPLWTGTAVGFLIAGVGVLYAAITVLILLLADYMFPMGGGAGFSLLTGFLIGPIAVLAGFPWSLLAFRSDTSAVGTVLYIVAADLINGSIIGFLVGMITKMRHRRSQ